MKQTFEIAKRELRIQFYSPIGWLLLVVFSIQLGSLLSFVLNMRISQIWSSLSDRTTSLTYNMLFAKLAVIPGIANNLYLYIPLLTMGLLSREFSDGTIKLLFSSPIRTKDIVLGKFIAMMAYSGVMMVLVALLSILLGLYIIRDIDVHLILWGFFMLYLLICTYAAIGLYVSSLTSYQFVAALGAVGVLFALNFSSRLPAETLPSFVSSILVWLKGISFFYWFTGYIGSWDIFYFILVIGLFIGLTYNRLQSIRTLRSFWSGVSRNICLIGLVLLLAYLSSRPSMKYYKDVRRIEVKDTKILINGEDMAKWQAILMQGIPVTIALMGVFQILRRQSR